MTAEELAALIVDRLSMQHGYVQHDPGYLTDVVIDGTYDLVELSAAVLKAVQ